MKKLTSQLVLPLTIISFSLFTKWWFVIPVDAPELLMKGFPLPYICPGWHTSLSLQIFLGEFLVDLLVYFSFWWVIVCLFDRVIRKIKVHKAVKATLMVISILILTLEILIISNPDNKFYLTRDFGIEILDTGYQFNLNPPERPVLGDYDQD
ncbi:MAG: hypothetical protein AAF502_06610 [Bacteroidota bacterium]